MIRKATVKGRFYPSSEAELEGLIEKWEKVRTVPGGRAAIVPHAGYVFSGECAWKGLCSLDWDEFERLVIVGPSHRFPFSGISVLKSDRYEVISGEHTCDTLFAEKIRETMNLSYIEQAHFEHSTEVQVPLIHKLAPTLPIIECIYGDRAELKLQLLFRHVLSAPRTALLVSSDLSHYYSEAEARIIDDHIIEAIETGDLDELQKGEACGMPGIRTLLAYSNETERRLATVDYRTSADSPMGESGRVVGYLSAIMR